MRVRRIRIAGLQGLQGVIRKTVSDELQPDIWEQHHMDKIVPSLLYNMHSGNRYRGLLCLFYMYIRCISRYPDTLQ